jgi:hypothetical protein
MKKSNPRPTGRLVIKYLGCAIILALAGLTIFSTYHAMFGSSGSSGTVITASSTSNGLSTTSSASTITTVSLLQYNSSTAIAQTRVTQPAITTTNNSSLETSFQVVETHRMTTTAADATTTTTATATSTEMNYTALASGTDETAQSAVAGVIVPLYTPPSDSSWAELLATKNAYPDVPIIAIINPDSGPGYGQSSEWEAGIAQLRAAGIKVIGYVATGYGATPVSSVEQQVEEYASWYQLDGIFFDEMANYNGTGSCPVACTMQQYYTDLVNYTSSLGYNLTVGNPGTNTLPSLEGIMSVLVIYENSGSASLATLQAATVGHDRSEYGSISIGVGLNSTQEISSAGYVGWIYMTDQCTGQSVSVCNPYNGLPSYFTSLVSNLAR